MECDDVQSEGNLLQRRLILTLVQTATSSPHNLAEKRRSIGESTGIEGRLLGEEAEAIEDTRDERGKRFCLIVLGHDRCIDTAQDSNAQCDARDAKSVRADFAEGLKRNEIS